jgi:hypothetical protein
VTKDVRPILLLQADGWGEQNAKESAIFMARTRPLFERCGTPAGASTLNAKNSSRLHFGSQGRASAGCFAGQALNENFPNREFSKNIFKSWQIIRVGERAVQNHKHTTTWPQKHHKKPSRNTYFSSKPLEKHLSGASKKK